MKIILCLIIQRYFFPGISLQLLPGIPCLYTNIVAFSDLIAQFIILKDKFMQLQAFSFELSLPFRKLSDKKIERSNKKTTILRLSY